MAASGVPVAVADTIWYKWLDKKYKGASTKMALRKAVVDFVVGAPLINMVWLTGEFSTDIHVNNVPTVISRSSLSVCPQGKGVGHLLSRYCPAGPVKVLSRRGVGTLAK